MHTSHYLFAHATKALTCNAEWVHFRGICQMTTPKVWSNTAQGCNHQSVHAPDTTFMPGCSGTDVLPWRDEGSGEFCDMTEPHRIVAPTQAWIHAAKFTLKTLHSSYYCLPNNVIGLQLGEWQGRESIANSGGRFTKKQRIRGGVERMAWGSWHTRERERERESSYYC